MNQTQPKLRIGTRGSALALAQARETRDRLRAAVPDLADEGTIEIVVIKSTGDMVRDRALSEIGGKGLFVKELETALEERRIDIAVHSLKDVETRLAPGTRLAAVLPREDPRDVLVANAGASLATLPEKAVMGTASVRRRAIVLNRRPDLSCVLFRGNVDTRLAKLAAGEADATLLAASGLNRLGMLNRATAILDPEEMPPAVAQGAIGIQAREEETLLAWCSAIDHPESHRRVVAERAMLDVLDGSCQTPISGLAHVGAGGEIQLTGYVWTLDGEDSWRADADAGAGDETALGEEVGRRLRDAAGDRLPR